MEETLSRKGINAGSSYYSCITTQYDGLQRININSLAKVAKVDLGTVLNELCSLGIQIEKLEIDDHQSHLDELIKTNYDSFHDYFIRLWLEKAQTYYPMSDSVPFVFSLRDEGVSERSGETLTSITAKYLPVGTRFMIDPPELFYTVGFLHVRNHCSMDIGFQYEDEVFRSHTPDAIEVDPPVRGKYRGVGRALMILALHHAKSLGLSDFSASLTNPRKFMLDLGFTDIGDRAYRFDLCKPIPKIFIEPRIPKKT
jgi:hypothetical protein